VRAARQSGRAAAALLALWAVACVTPYTEEQLHTKLEVAAKPVSASKQQRIIPIYADSKIVAFGLLTEAKHDPSSELSRHLSRSLELARKRHNDVVVGGPYGDLNDQIVQNALGLSDRGSLAGVRLIYVSPQPPSEALLHAASQAHASLYHCEFR
jgi:hypothetical protein